MTAGVSSSAHRNGPVRSDDARRAILMATAEQFMAKGYERLTIQGIATAAKVGKQTIYRWWGGKADLVAECLVEGVLWDSGMVVGDTGDVVQDVATWLRLLLDVDQSGAGESLRSLLGAAAGDESLARHLDDLMRGQLEGGITRRLRLAHERGELADQVDVALTTELLLGLVMVRTLARRPSRTEELEGLVRLLLDQR
ncbi:TetR/AcrR family transcriptional regulator [Nocardioides jishulii]|uniref:TetR/AcrR family transcriptional regulator n=1 Tax=Nocardioides jishulii TaxID=2575440 RepID=A0A4U2YH80_9ACTN|nr:TetR/AcrR family transcriptional regulator [Nocardioides jishulii]QCX26691.1 TetR/AcrR family transcriptional regulator [Nocardioides jishulii]TKI60339.1 TetR/AcrR family transcriptional regulator [Nocardioides jishulii]